MNKALRPKIAVVGLLLVCGLLTLPGSAMASCRGHCELVFLFGQKCTICTTASFDTGLLCDQLSECVCYYTQCPFALQTSAETVATVQDALAAELFKAPEPSAQTPNLEGGCTPEQVLFGLPAGR